MVVVWWAWLVPRPQTTVSVLRIGAVEGVVLIRAGPVGGETTWLARVEDEEAVQAATA